MRFHVALFSQCLDVHICGRKERSPKANTVQEHTGQYKMEGSPKANMVQEHTGQYKKEGVKANDYRQLF